MVCQRCKSLRILSVSCHHRDCASFQELDTGYEEQGYAPKIPGFSGGDETGFDVCMECGQIQGDWPKASIATEEYLENKDKPWYQIKSSVQVIVKNGMRMVQKFEEVKIIDEGDGEKVYVQSYHDENLKFWVMKNNLELI